MPVSLCPTCHRLAAAPTSEPLNILADLPVGEGHSQDEGTFPLPQLPSRDTGPIPVPFLLCST